jgi:hypothetical protein
MAVLLSSFLRRKTQAARIRSPTTVFYYRIVVVDLTIPYPRTLEGFFSLLEKPLQTWYPLSIPKEFNSEYGFRYDRALSEQAKEIAQELDVIAFCRRKTNQ